MEELKTCPFCQPTNICRDKPNNFMPEYIHCEDCGCVNGLVAWNTRATDPLLKEMAEALLIAKDIINRYANNNKRIAGYSNIEDALQKYHEQVGDTDAK